MFESNFPVDKMSHGYGVFWNACKKLVRGASETEKDAASHRIGGLSIGDGVANIVGARLLTRPTLNGGEGLIATLTLAGDAAVAI